MLPYRWGKANGNPGPEMRTRPHFWAKGEGKRRGGETCGLTADHGRASGQIREMEMRLGGGGGYFAAPPPGGGPGGPGPPWKKSGPPQSMGHRSYVRHTSGLRGAFCGRYIRRIVNVREHILYFVAHSDCVPSSNANLVVLAFEYNLTAGLLHKKEVILGNSMTCQIVVCSYFRELSCSTKSCCFEYINTFNQ